MGAGFAQGGVRVAGGEDGGAEPDAAPCHRPPRRAPIRQRRGPADGALRAAGAAVAHVLRHPLLLPLLLRTQVLRQRLCIGSPAAESCSVHLCNHQRWVIWRFSQSGLA